MIMLVWAALQVETAIECERAPEKVERSNSLGTRGYAPRKNEEKHFKDLKEEEQTPGSLFGDYKITGKKGARIGWFGIVREIARPDKDEDDTVLTIEHKYFDGLTDTHIMALSFNGGGDFKAKVRAKELKLETLMLVKVYGTVADEKDGVPSVDADFVRAWPWKTFTFLMAYGEDRSNKKWRDLNTIKLDVIYDPWPDDAYYVKRLGERKKP